MTNPTPKYKRVLLKLSGEAFLGKREYGIDPAFLRYISTEIKKVHDLKIDLGIVIGGGNIFRGEKAAANGMDRVMADYSGMLATVMNAIALQDGLTQAGVESRVQTAFEIRAVAEPFILGKALRHFQKGRIVIFAGGTGNPYFTTDTTAALRAAEIKAEIIFKATQVDGVYSADPKKDPNAIRHEQLTFNEVINKQLKVMDMSAFAMSRDNNIPIMVFDISKPDNILRAVLGEKVGTLVS